MSPESVISDVSFTTDQTRGVSDASIVLETVTEDLSIKRDVFADVGAAAPDDAVLASNTSGIPITDIADGFEFADRLVGCHWWYPPYLLTPVEVIRGQETADGPFERMQSFIKSVDRDPVVVNKDVPGFVWNRIQHAVIRECLHLVEEDVASIADINRAIRDGYATRTSVIGPFETMDIAGLELVKTVSAELYPYLDDDDDPSPLFDEYISSGRGGIDDGAGFFEYDETPEEITGRRDQRVAAIRRALSEVDQ
jgi:3-hydroxyacyl-CoA dehydrogenase